MPTLESIPVLVPVLLVALGVSSLGFSIYYRRRGPAYRNQFYVALAVAAISLLLAGAFSVVSRAA